jgi:hypothetical protein
VLTKRFIPVNAATLRGALRTVSGNFRPFARPPGVTMKCFPVTKRCIHRLRIVH